MTYKSRVLFFLVSIVVSCPAQERNVVFRVIVPKGMSRDATIHIAGNQPSLGNWDPAIIELQRENDSTWTITEKFHYGTELEFKFTRGSWNKQAIYNEGVIPGNFKLAVIQDTTIVIRPLSWSDFYAPADSGITGTVTYHRSLKAEGLRFSRDALVWLPPSYAKDLLRRYPVLYLHDGQNVFDPAQFIVHQLKPFIDRTYRTKTDPANTAVMGSSMGGLISFLFVWWYPDVFSKAGCLSSAFLFGEDRILKDVASCEGPRKSVRVYMDCGGAGMEAQLKPGMDEMKNILLKKGYNEGVDFEYFYDEHAEHNERAWSERVWRPLMFMFGKN
ncbi:MAG: hypothetical protein HYY49_10190 [Ignavibacteriales bacterium]|nr:hypothetical protein [Ignavibacteriales bacterium]